MSSTSKIVQKAIRAGLLIRKPCEVCGADKSQGHHDDYSKPLSVRWLCSPHHHEHHEQERRVAEMRRIARARK